MHMSDALISVAVGGAMAGVSTATIGYSIKKIKSSGIEENTIPMMGVMGAFVFAAQMINFTIPITGSSGHIGGGILLAALLGPYPALITLASVLFIQCLFFADGGLLALGCNIFNIAVIPCLIIYPLIYRPILIKKLTPRRITVGSILAVVVGLQLGAFSVVLETLLSGITELPFPAFVALMQPIHLAIGLVEGIVTAAVLCFIYSTRKNILEHALGDTSEGKSSRKIIYVIFTVGAILLGGVVSSYASSNPDGLEWAILKVTQGQELESDSEIHAVTQQLQEQTAFFPDYAIQNMPNKQIASTINPSGVVGGLIILVTALLFGVIISGYKRLKRNKH
jgi:cobalt/nickel transport system permease protein